MIQTESGQQVLLRQIAGVVARRSVCYVGEQMRVEQGQEFGFIKLGSRVDLLLPPGSEVLVAPGERTVGGK